jgi:hypothetical protein
MSDTVRGPDPKALKLFCEVMRDGTDERVLEWRMREGKKFCVQLSGAGTPPDPITKALQDLVDASDEYDADPLQPTGFDGLIERAREALRGTPPVERLTLCEECDARILDGELECPGCGRIQQGESRALPPGEDGERREPSIRVTHEHDVFEWAERMAPTGVNPLDVVALARLAARKHHYALAIHGSLARDLDLVAIPWREKASEPEVVVEAIRAAVGGMIFVAEPDGRDGYYSINDETKHSPNDRPHGRRAWSIYGVLGGSYIDLSVMPLRPPLPEGGRGPEALHVHASDGSCVCHYPAYWLAKMEAAGMERGAAMWRGHLNALHAAREATLRGRAEPTEGERLTDERDVIVAFIKAEEERWREASFKPGGQHASTRANAAGQLWRDIEAGLHLRAALRTGGAPEGEKA